MAVPLIYNLRSVRARWVSAIVAVVGIAGTVGVFIAMLALAKGFEKTLVSSGSPQNAIIMRAGSTSEMTGSVTLDQVKIIQDAPQVAREGNQPLVTPEVVVIADFPLKSTGTDANVQVRGVPETVLKVRNNVRVVEGHFITPGLSELVVGRNVPSTYSGLDLGSTVKFGGGTWKVVGIFDAGGSAFDSEVWADSRVLADVYKRPNYIFQSVTARLTSPEAFTSFKDTLTSDPRMTVQADREIDYYAKQSRNLATLITVLGSLVAMVMGIGAVFGALNTMYSSVSARTREIATLRALGFGSGAVVVSVMVESLALALIGGAVGAVLSYLTFNGLHTSTMNWNSFSQITFAFAVTPNLLLQGIVWAVLIGLIGGLFPAIRGARLPIAAALREL